MTDQVQQAIEELRAYAAVGKNRSVADKLETLIQALEELRTENKRLRQAAKQTWEAIRMRAYPGGDAAISEALDVLDEALYSKPTTQETGQGDEWIQHGMNERPRSLAPAQLVWYESDIMWSWGSPAKGRVDRLTWHPGLRYRPALSANGEWLCSAKGLAPWAQWVATDENGAVCQYAEKPILNNHGYWYPGNWPDFCEVAPQPHRRPGPASESLMEVDK